MLRVYHQAPILSGLSQMQVGRLAAGARSIGQQRHARCARRRIAGLLRAALRGECRRFRWREPIDLFGVTSRSVQNVKPIGPPRIALSQTRVFERRLSCTGNQGDFRCKNVLQNWVQRQAVSGTSGRER
jgi:hypothetical protein